MKFKYKKGGPFDIWFNTLIAGFCLYFGIVALFIDNELFAYVLGFIGGLFLRQLILILSEEIKNDDSKR